MEFSGGEYKIVKHKSFEVVPVRPIFTLTIKYLENSTALEALWNQQTICRNSPILSTPTFYWSIVSEFLPRN